MAIKYLYLVTSHFCTHTQSGLPSVWRHYADKHTTCLTLKQLLTYMCNDYYDNLCFVILRDCGSRFVPITLYIPRPHTHTTSFVLKGVCVWLTAFQDWVNCYISTALNTTPSFPLSSHVSKNIPKGFLKKLSIKSVRFIYGFKHQVFTMLCTRANCC